VFAQVTHWRVGLKRQVAGEDFVGDDAQGVNVAARVQLVALHSGSLLVGLLSSLDTERQRKIDDLWAEEAEDRIDAFERGEIRAVSAKAAFETNKGAKP